MAQRYREGLPELQRIVQRQPNNAEALQLLALAQSSGKGISNSDQAALVTYQLSLNMWVGVFLSLIVALAIGFINGYLVVRTKIPSFLITLSTVTSRMLRRSSSLLCTPV